MSLNVPTILIRNESLKKQKNWKIPFFEQKLSHVFFQYMLFYFAYRKLSKRPNQMPQFILEHVLSQFKSPLAREQQEMYRALTVPNTQSIKPHKFTKIFLNLSSKNQYLSDRIRKFR